MKKLKSSYTALLWVIILISFHQAEAQNNVFYGPGAGGGGRENVNVGVAAGANITGTENVNVGNYAGGSLSSGGSNTNVGTNAGFNINSGMCNSNFGNAAGQYLTGTENSNFGYIAGRYITGIGNSNFGSRAGSAITTASLNSFFGFNAGARITKGGSNTILGYEAGMNLGANDRIANNNSFIGSGTGYNIITGSGNFIAGYQAGFNTQAADNNVLIGTYSGISLLNMSKNVLIGGRIGVEVKQKSERNVVIGYEAGMTMPFADGSVLLGYRAGSGIANTDITAASEKSVFIVNNQTNLNRPLLYGYFAKNTNPDDPTSKPYAMARLGINTHELIDSTSLTVSGAVHIGPAEIDPQSFKYDSLTNHYLLWVEKGIVSEDYAVANVKDWKDCVFADDYRLEGLQSVAAFITKNRHLPNIPSQAEVLAHGYSMHDMNKRLLQKVEELTLYIIEQDKAIKSLQVNTAQTGKDHEISNLKQQLTAYQSLADEVEKIKKSLSASAKIDK